MAQDGDRVQTYRLLLAEVYELAGQSRRTSEALARTVGQTAARWHVLSVLSDHPRTVSAAARRLGLTRQSVQRVVDALVAEGLLALEVNPDHTRAPLVALTATGRDTLAAVVRCSEDDRRAVLERAAVTVEELAAARAVLSRLSSALLERPT